MTVLSRVGIAAMVLFAWVPPVAAEARQLSCTGSMIEPTGFTPSPKSAQVIIGNSRDNVSIDLGNGVIDAPVVSDNKIQLKFETKDFVGEYFDYTGDLFLIYPSGHLARLTCAAK